MKHLRNQWEVSLVVVQKPGKQIRRRCSKYLLSVYWPGSVLRTSKVVSHVTFAIAHGGWYCYQCPHFPDERTQRGEPVTRKHLDGVLWSLGLNPDKWDSRQIQSPCSEPPSYTALRGEVEEHSGDSPGRALEAVSKFVVFS